eukprot:GHUV01026976.1.p2 GENE.GHUV01026976.1~~GHUV01026976.1.p2  ORF type:complete len:140 (+),score=45.05 GHUV01026976.1:902-1321(+)
MALVVSDRVINAVAGRDFCRQAMVNSIVTEQGGIFPPGSAAEHADCEALLHPVGATIPKVEFKAQLARDAFGCKDGDAVPVSLFLSSVGSPWAMINGQYQVVQLLLGPSVRDQASMQAIMGPPPAAATAAGTAQASGGS